MRTIEEMTEAECRSLLANILECVRAGREPEFQRDVGDAVSDEMEKAGLDVDAPSSYMRDEDDEDDEDD